MDSIIATAAGETLADIARWADAMWDGREPDTSALDRRLALAMTVGAMAGVSTPAMAEMVGDPGPDRHRSTDEVFRDMVEAIAKRRPTLAVLDPKTLSENMRQTAWFVTGVVKGKVLDRIREKLIEARVRGLGQPWFAEQVKRVADLSLGHIETVFRTNVESAAGAARWKQAHDPDTSDLWWGYRYWNPRDERSRPLHRAMHGFIAVPTDPIWRTIWTPNGFRCRCKCRELLRREVVGKLVDEKGRQIATRWFVDDLQREVVASVESGTAVVVGRRRLRFPDEGFRGNALMDLV